MDDVVWECRALVERALGGDRSAVSLLAEKRAALEKLARDGHAGAQTLLGRIAVSVERDDDAAAIWLALAAEQDDPSALRLLGYLHEHGHGVAEDQEEAARLQRRSAALGDALAMFNLGSMCLDGRGVARDLGEAERWLRACIERDGYPHAWERLGVVLEACGDREGALAAWRRAAEGDVVGAMARMLRSARDAGDLVEAARWGFRMLRCGQGDGVHEVLQLARRMEPAQLREAARLAGDASLAETTLSTIARR